jgi:4-hydroxy-tetrahydrodipicolinate synthase
MSAQVKFSGVWTALVTPFLQDKSIDWQAFEILLQRQVAAKVSGVVVCGSTGEANSLLVQEKLSLIKKAKAVVGNSIKIMAGTGSANSEQTLELSKLALDSGADALLVVSPPYTKPNPQGVLAHFRYLSAGLQGKSDICLYHVPSRTGQKLSEETLLELLQIPGMSTIKESSADLLLLSTLAASKNNLVLSGEDPLFLPSLAAGARGLVSVSANIFPQEVVQIYQEFVAGNFAKAYALHQALLQFNKDLFIESNPCPCKQALSFLGLCQNTMRLPLAPLTEDNKKILQQSLEATQKLFSSI